MAKTLTPFEKRERAIMKAHPDSIWMRMREPVIVPVETITGGSLVFDALTEAGGDPLRYFSHYWGKQSVGKTTLKLSAAAQNSRKGKVCYLDVELKTPHEYFERIILANGGNLDNITLVRPGGGADVLGIMEGFIGWCVAIYVDSIAAVKPTKMMNPTDPDQVFMGSQSKFVGDALDRMRFPLSRSGLHFEDLPVGTAIVLINQARADFNAKKGDKLKPYGGYAQMHGIGLSMKIGSGFVNDDRTGAKVTGWVTKNNVGRPRDRGETGILFDMGVDLGLDTLLAGIKMGMIDARSAGHYYWPDGGKIAHGRERAKRAIMDMGWDDLYKFRDEIRAAIVAGKKEEEVADVETIE